MGADRQEEFKDSQPLQSLESVVEPWFKSLAYALILPRRDGYPCVFAADYYGASYKDVGNDGNEHEINLHSHKWMIDNFLEVRRDHAWGEQYDYFDHPDCVGWTRTGDKEHPQGMAVLLNNGEDSKKHMETGKAGFTLRQKIIIYILPGILCEDIFWLLNR